MTATKRKKQTRMLGTRTQGWGRFHRGKGGKGGAGNAGQGKKAHCKKPRVWGQGYFGPHGFRRRANMPSLSTINIKDLEIQANIWVQKEIAEKKGDTIVVDLTKLGFDKLLSEGNATQKFQITVEKTSAKAAEKIQAAGGEIVVNE